MSTQAFGVDIGGSGVKGAPVDMDKGGLATERIRIPTPATRRPSEIVECVVKLIKQFDWHGPVGVTFPGVVQHGVIRTAANFDKSWLSFDLRTAVAEGTGLDVTVLNDADAAGLAEVRFGAAKGRTGTVILTTLGTGIGTALVFDGRLIPNTELGHIQVEGVDYETKASAEARERDGLSMERWAKRLSKYYTALENLLWPDVFVVGGGVSKKAAEFLPLVNCRTPLVPALLRNDAGIVGAALQTADPAS